MQNQEEGTFFNNISESSDDDNYQMPEEFQKEFQQLVEKTKEYFNNPPKDANNNPIDYLCYVFDNKH